MNISQDGFFFPPPPPPPPPTINEFHQTHQECFPNPNPNPNPNPAGTTNKRKRNSSRAPDSETEVVALSPKSLMAAYRFICEICNKGFQREQNLQLHRRGHNLPWKLKQRANKDQVKKKVYICPEPSCVHHDPSRALGDLTGIKKHFSRKHGEKKFKCDKCPKKYAVMSDLKAHSKICGTREYKCDCGTIFSRKDSFSTHRAFCDTLTEERMKINTATMTAGSLNPNYGADLINSSLMAAPQSTSSGIFSFATSHRPDFLALEPSSSNGSNSMGAEGLINKPRSLPLWLDHYHIIPEVMNSNIHLTCSASEAFIGSSSSGSGAARVFPEPSPANLNLFASSSPVLQRTALLKEEQEKNRPSFHPESFISLYSSPLSSSSSSPGNLSATAFLQKAAQMGSARSDNNSTLLANTFNNGDVNLHQRHLFRHQINDQLAMMDITLNGDDYDDGLGRGQGIRSSTSTVGMRDFLGSLGGGGKGDNSGGGQGERRVILQDGIGYKFATMAGSHDHQQEPHMSLMR